MHGQFTACRPFFARVSLKWQGQFEQEQQTVKRVLLRIYMLPIRSEKKHANMQQKCAFLHHVNFNLQDMSKMGLFCMKTTESGFIFQFFYEKKPDFKQKLPK